MNQYSILNAVLYELLIELIKIWPRLKLNQWVSAALNWCRHDWIEWRTEQTLKDVDRQAQKLVKEWEAQEEPKYKIIEHKPDESRAQNLLGGTMEIKSTWHRD